MYGVLEKNMLVCVQFAVIVLCVFVSVCMCVENAVAVTKYSFTAIQSSIWKSVFFFLLLWGENVFQLVAQVLQFWVPNV